VALAVIRIVGPEVMSASEACRALRASADRLAAWVRCGALPVVVDRVGPARELYRRSDLERFANSYPDARRLIRYALRPPGSQSQRSQSSDSWATEMGRD
jgi:predicted site-specific integrase-resolvase